jgi:hypothetical protein
MATTSDFGDFRIDSADESFREALREKRTASIRGIAGSRAKKVRFNRLLSNPKYSTDKLLNRQIKTTKETIANAKCNHILVLGDTTSLSFESANKNTRASLGLLSGGIANGTKLTK